MVYNIDINCIYSSITDVEESNDKYREELLKIFCLKEYDDDKIQKETDRLFKMMWSDRENKEDLNALFKVVRENNTWPIDLNDYMCFIILFSYDYFYLFNDCIKDFMIDKEISKENITKFENFNNKENI